MVVELTHYCAGYRYLKLGEELVEVTAGGDGRRCRPVVTEPGGPLRSAGLAVCGGGGADA